MLLNISKTILVLLLCTQHVFANEHYQLVNTVEKVIKLTRKQPSISTSTSASNQQEPNTKVITLPVYHFSDRTRQAIYDRIQRSLDHDMYGNKTLHASTSKPVQLGMDQVPVLDQGPHGTCATFAATAAVDAAINKGDYISQTCLLQLGNHLNLTNREPSGWDGLSSYDALDRISTHGIISIKKQKKYGCSGLRYYPYWSNRSYAPMSPEEYHEHSTSISNQFNWNVLFDQFPADSSNKYSTLVKKALKKGNRVTMGVLLPKADSDTMGADGWHHYFNDTWVLTSSISEELAYQTELPGHAMVITGYDDNAVAMDGYGHRHHGLFTLRNSWGSWVADWGDFYMSYDYFDALTVDAHEIEKNKLN